jgi:omega-6 fatty acid desaturase (delta-12 desaturase)
MIKGKYKTDYLRDSVYVLAFLIAQIALVTWYCRDEQLSGTLQALFLSIVLPFFTFSFLISAVIYLHHTNPVILWFKDIEKWKAFDGRSNCTVHVTFPGPINFIFHNIMEHTAHHARPSIPMYELVRAEKHLQEQGLTNEFKWSLQNHLHVARTCKLFDFDKKCWTDFKGRPTTVPRSIRHEQ